MELKVKKGLAFLRISLGIFLLLWGIDKLVSPESTVKIFEMFYLTGIGLQGAMILGGLEVLLSLAIIGAVWKEYSYGLGLLLHGFSTVSTYKQLLNPFGKNHLFIAALPILAGFLVIYMLRDYDTVWNFKTKPKA